MRPPDIVSGIDEIHLTLFLRTDVAAEQISAGVTQGHKRVIVSRRCAWQQEKIAGHDCAAKCIHREMGGTAVDAEIHPEVGCGHRIEDVSYPLAQRFGVQPRNNAVSQAGRTAIGPAGLTRWRISEGAEGAK